MSPRRSNVTETDERDASSFAGRTQTDDSRKKNFKKALRICLKAPIGKDLNAFKRNEDFIENF